MDLSFLPFKRKKVKKINMLIDNYNKDKPYGKNDIAFVQQL